MKERRNLETGRRLSLLEEGEDRADARLAEHTELIDALLAQTTRLRDLLRDALALHFIDVASDRVEATRSFQKKVDAAF